MTQFGRAVLGGTFDRLHRGHEGLLAVAFARGRTVAIGLTTERYLAEHPKPDSRGLQSYAQRHRTLVAWLRRHYPTRRWRVVPIDDRFGGSVTPGVGVLVVSAETVGGGRAVNAERRRRGLPPVPVEVVPLALADDLRPIASRRIRAGEIDRRGRRLSPIRVGVRSSRPADSRTTGRAVRRVFPTATVVRTVSGSTDPELTVEVRRAPRGGWVVRERGAQLTLGPFGIPGATDTALERGVVRVLRPSGVRRPG